MQTFFLVDPKGIEPSNLTDANRALSQLSYGPMFARRDVFLAERTVYLIAFTLICQEKKSYFLSFFLLLPRLLLVLPSEAIR